MCDLCDAFGSQVEAYENLLKGNFTPEDKTDSVFTQDMQDTLDELYELDDEANALADTLQKSINIQDMQMEYLLEAMSTLILTEEDIADLKFNLLDGQRNDKYTFLEVVYFMSILNEYDNPYDRENAKAKAEADEEFNEWEDDK